MNIMLELDKMTVTDKIRIMEHLWDELCMQPEKVTSPLWHNEILSQREQTILEGKEKFNDWQSQKEKIRQSLK